LTGQLQSNDLFFASPAVIAGGAPAKLYAPAVFEPLSSFNHLDETAYPGGTPNSLMTPNIAQQEAIHDPGALARRMFSDLGWGPASSAPGAAPAAVLNLVARTVGNTATLTWSASALATSYRLIAIGPGVNLDRNIGNVTTVSGSVPPGTYAISVFAVNAAGESAPATTSFVIGGAALPSPPSVVTPVVVGRTVSITWTRVADATAYRLVATLNGVPILDANVGDANSISASECPAGSYTVTVYAVNGVGQSAVGTSTAFSIS
jgi:predicted phage tail protein